MGVIRKASASSRTEKRPLSTDHEPLLVAAADELRKLLAELALTALDRSRLGRRDR